MRERIQGIPCTWMRGGTSKGACFLEHDLPAAEAKRDALLLAVTGSPDPRRIDGIGGTDPLTGKVAVVAASERPDADVDYLFLHVLWTGPSSPTGRTAETFSRASPSSRWRRGWYRPRPAAPRSPSTWSTAIRSPG